jgi:glycosyltransferase involved in cell wall biosynthesis
MRFALVTSGVPNPAAGGATLTNWTVASYLLKAGHEVAVLPLLPREFVDATGTSVDERIERLRTLGAEVHPIASVADTGGSPPSRSAGARLRRMWRPEDELLFPHLLDRGLAREALAEIRPDAAFVYHWEALAATYGIDDVPRLGVAVDPAHLPGLYRWRASLRRPTPAVLRAGVRIQAQVRRQPQLMVELLQDCEAAGDLAAHHAAWLRERGATRCEYLHTPVPDPFEDGEPTRPSAADRPRVLLIGHLRGTATMDGLALFAHKVLPRLERALGPDGVDVRIVGGYELPPALRSALDSPNVVFSGHLEDPTEEILAADVMVVPTTIPLGTRVRILTAFSYGCCVAAHASNALGIPELVDGENALLGRTGEELADRILAALRDDALRARIASAGRATFERSFAPPVAAGRIEAILETIAAARTAA